MSSKSNLNLVRSKQKSNLLLKIATLILQDLLLQNLIQSSIKQRLSLLSLKKLQFKSKNRKRVLLYPNLLRRPLQLKLSQKAVFSMTKKMGKIFLRRKKSKNPNKLKRLSLLRKIYYLVMRIRTMIFSRKKHFQAYLKINLPKTNHSLNLQLLPSLKKK